MAGVYDDDEFDMPRPASGKPRRFITPTQGLMPRKGQGLTSNLQNLGGRLMIRAEMERHKSHMKQVKPVISRPNWRKPKWPR